MLQCDFNKVALHICSTPLPKNTSEGLNLNKTDNIG